METVTKNRNKNLLGAIIFRNFPISYFFPESFEGSIFFQLSILYLERNKKHIICKVTFAKTSISFSSSSKNIIEIIWR